MNCAMARALKWSYFSTGLNNFAEEELINLNLIKIRTEWEKGLTTLSEVSNPIRKKYYKVLCT